MTGLPKSSSVANAVCAAFGGVRALSRSPASPTSSSSFTSAPATNALPAPVTTIATVSSRWRMCCSTVFSSSSARSLSEFTGG
jgi:hypothetical protein